MSIQLYGHWDGRGSFSSVSYALAWALKRARVPGTLYQIKSLRPSYPNVTPFPVGMNNRADVGIYIDYPEASVGWLKTHQQRVLVTVCETKPVPAEWVEAANKATLVVVPSRWCASVFKEAGVKTEIMIVPHGVSQFLLDASGDAVHTDVHARPIKMLHVSGAVSFPQRKGTPQLMRAFADLFARDSGYVGLDLELHLKMPRTSGLDRAIASLGDDVAQRIQIVDEWWPERDLRRKYRAYDVVVQPSRGEGFGMVPLEARAAGVPVVATTWGGHSEHCTPHNVVQVEAAGLAETMATQGNPFGRAPTVSAATVKTALLDFLQNQSLYKSRAANANMQAWLWSRVTAPFAKRIAKMTASPHALRPGEEAGLR